MSRNINNCSDHSVNWLLTLAKCIANWIIRHPLYVFYIIIFSPYILKLICLLLSPFLILLLATFCAFSTFISNTFRMRNEEPQENVSNNPLEAEAYNIIFDTFHDSATNLTDKSDEVEVYKQIDIQESAPEIVKPCCFSTPHNLPLHETLVKPDISLEDELSTNAIFNTLPNLITNVANKSKEDEAESIMQIKFKSYTKSCSSSTPFQDPPLHEIATKTDISINNEPSTNTNITTFHNSVIHAANKSDEVETSKHINFKALAPEIVKSCYTSTPPQDPPFHETVAKMTDCTEDKLSIKAAKSEDETEIIIKHMVCINNLQTKHQTDYVEQFKAAVAVQINKAETIPFTTTPRTGSNAHTDQITDLHKTSRSYDFTNTKSMRRDKEWTRTLACKLFEERQKIGEDGMDMLWETLEDDPIEPPPPPSRRRTMSRWSSRSVKSDRSIRVSADEEDDGDDVDDDVAGSEKMCCLHALKMSSGKVNLGIKSKNMIKFSKVLRRFGWLHKTSNAYFTK